MTSLRTMLTLLLCLAIMPMAACSGAPTLEPEPAEVEEQPTGEAPDAPEVLVEEVVGQSVDPEVRPAATTTEYVDQNGDVAYVPAGFSVSEDPNEQIVDAGLVVIGPDGSEFVWVPTAETGLSQRDFGSYFSAGGGNFARYQDGTSLDAYQDMVASVGRYGGFYMGRYEASMGVDGLPCFR